MERNDNLRPASLGVVSGNQDFGSDIRDRAIRLRGLISPGAQTNNTDNYTILPIKNLLEFREHPFQVRDDEELAELAESIKESGLLEAILVRPLGNDQYEILAGHRRVAACKKNGLDDIPAKILNVDDSEAAIIMTNTNLKRREKILPSERAKAYQMQMEAYRCQGKRTDLVRAVQEGMDFCANGAEVATDTDNNFGANGAKVDSREKVAQLNKTTPHQISRYIRLTKLIKPLLDKVDSEEIAFRTGVELSFLSTDEQQMVVEAMDNNIRKKVEVKMAEELRRLSKAGQLNDEAILHLFQAKTGEKRAGTYTIFQKATKKALNHFKKVDYGQIELDQKELEQIIIQAIQSYAENKR